jgi:hypothetical protein
VSTDLVDAVLGFFILIALAVMSPTLAAILGTIDNVGSGFGVDMLLLFIPLLVLSVAVSFRDP